MHVILSQGLNIHNQLATQPASIIPRVMPPSKPAVPLAAKPLYGSSFDPWNSSSTGHQRPDNTPGTGWRDSRNKKLNSQFEAGSSGGERRGDTFGAGSELWDSDRQVVIPKSVRDRRGRSVRDMLVKRGLMKEAMESSAGHSPPPRPGQDEECGLLGMTEGERAQESRREEDEEKARPRAEKKPKIFGGLTIYVNGSTFPLISDHKLKHVLSEQGALMSTHLGRRRVTHVILGKPTGSGAGAGGGLAGGKLQKEIARLRGCGIKFVGAEWVLESLKAGRRLPEARFATTKLAAKAQGSVYGLFSKQSTTTI